MAKKSPRILLALVGNVQQSLHIFVRSRLVRDSLEQDYGIPKEKISLVGGGVNFHPLPKVVTARHQIQSPVALFIGKDFMRKGGDFLLKAFAIVRKQFLDARLRLVTSQKIPPGLPRDGVKVYPATWNRNSIRELYHAADVLCFHRAWKPGETSYSKPWLLVCPAPAYRVMQWVKSLAATKPGWLFRQRAPKLWLMPCYVCSEIQNYVPAWEQQAADAWMYCLPGIR